MWSFKIFFYWKKNILKIFALLLYCLLELLKLKLNYYS